MAEKISAVYNFLYKKEGSDSNIELLLGYQGNPFLFNNWNYTKEDINLTAQNITFNCEKFNAGGESLKIENSNFWKKLGYASHQSWASPVYGYSLTSSYTTIKEFYDAVLNEVHLDFIGRSTLINNKFVKYTMYSDFSVLELSGTQLKLYSSNYTGRDWTEIAEKNLTVNSAIFADEDSSDENSIHNRLHTLEDNMISADVFKADSTGAFLYSKNTWQKIPHNGHRTYVVYQLVAGATSTEGGLYLNCPRITTSNTIDISTFESWAIGATGYRTPPSGMGGNSKIAIIVLEVDTSQQKITYQKLYSGELETMSLKNRTLYTNGYWLVKAPQQ